MHHEGAPIPSLRWLSLLGLLVGALGSAPVALAGPQTAFLENVAVTSTADYTYQVGVPGDLPVSGDWNGDGTDTIGVFRPSTGQWFLANTNDVPDPSTAPPFTTYVYGFSQGLPVVGDWNGDGTDTIGLFDPTTGVWYITNNDASGVAQQTFQFGNPGDIPIAGDWSGVRNPATGKPYDEPGVYRPSTAQFFLWDSANTGQTYSLQFGDGGSWKPFVGDWDGDGKDTPGIYNPTTAVFNFRNDLVGGVATFTAQFGDGGGTPVAGDWAATRSTSGNLVDGIGLWVARTDPIPPPTVIPYPPDDPSSGDPGPFLQMPATGTAAAQSFAPAALTSFQQAERTYAYQYVGSDIGSQDHVGYNNSTYAAVGQTDCQNFISQILRYAGWSMFSNPLVAGSQYGWYYVHTGWSSLDLASHPWTGVNQFNQFIHAHPERGTFLTKFSQIQVGDIIQVHWKGSGKIYQHSMLVTQVDSPTLLGIHVTYHTSNYKNITLSQVVTNAQVAGGYLPYTTWTVEVIHPNPNA